MLSGLNRLSTIKLTKLGYHLPINLFFYNLYIYIYLHKFLSVKFSFFSFKWIKIWAIAWSFIHLSKWPIIQSNILPIKKIIPITLDSTNWEDDLFNTCPKTTVIAVADHLQIPTWVLSWMASLMELHFHTLAITNIFKLGAASSLL
jgi:hypothetical protein